MKGTKRHYEYNLQIIEQDSSCHSRNGQYEMRKYGNADWTYVINPPFEESEGENYNHKYTVDNYSIMLLFDNYLFESEPKYTKQINRLNDQIRKGFLSENEIQFEDLYLKAEKLKTKDNFEMIFIGKHNGVLFVNYHDSEKKIYPLDTLPLDAYKHITPLDEIRGTTTFKCGEWCKDGIYGLNFDFLMELHRGTTTQTLKIDMKTSTTGNFELEMKLIYFRGKQIIENLNTDSLISICYSYDVDQK